MYEHIELPEEIYSLLSKYPLSTREEATAQESRMPYKDALQKLEKIKEWVVSPERTVEELAIWMKPVFYDICRFLVIKGDDGRLLVKMIGDPRDHNNSDGSKKIKKVKDFDIEHWRRLAFYAIGYVEARIRARDDADSDLDDNQPSNTPYISPFTDQLM